MEIDPKILADLCIITKLDQGKIKTFLKRFSETSNNNNCRYDLIYSWVRQKAITYRQFKMLIKNITITDITKWRKLNGDYLFVDNDHRKQYPEDFMTA